MLGPQPHCPSSSTGVTCSRLFQPCVSRGISYPSSRYSHPSTGHRWAHDTFQGYSKLFSWSVLQDLRSSPSSNAQESVGPAYLQVVEGGTASGAGSQLHQKRGCSCMVKLGINRRLNPSAAVSSIFLFYLPLDQSTGWFGSKRAEQPSLSSPAQLALPPG